MSEYIKHQSKSPSKQTPINIQAADTEKDKAQMAPVPLTWVKQMQAMHGNQGVIRQLKGATAHLKDERLPESTHEDETYQKSEHSNRVGLPEKLRSGLETISGVDLSDVQVHYNSSKPAEVRALAYAQGNQIHLGPGQEKHLPHEGWHVVQQKKGLVKPTLQMKKDILVNDNAALESEADVMGQKAINLESATHLEGRLRARPLAIVQSQSPTIQRFKDGDDEVDVSELTNLDTILGYLKRIEELKLEEKDVEQLTDKFTALVKENTDAGLLFKTMTSMNSLGVEEQKIFGDKLNTSIQIRIEQLKHKKGVEMAEESENYSEDMITSRSKVFGELNKVGETYGKQYNSRSNFKRKHEELDRSVKESFTREGSVGLDIEGKYAAQKDKERMERKQQRIETDQKYNTTVRNAMEKINRLHSDKNPNDPIWKGKETYRTNPLIYQSEGLVGIYSDLKSVGPPDLFEFDHQPQNDIIETAANLNVSKGKKIEDVAKDHSQGGLTIVLAHERHAKGASYGKPSPHRDALVKIDQSSATELDKIKQIKQKLTEATQEDADEILTVYENDDNFPDVDAIVDSDKAKEIKDSIRARIKKGEAIIKSQTFDSWFES